ncbi:hypothetical protein CG747_42940 [Streptomyces sp. CB02959]|nr:hypothetical protein CG747_42940 [Streptomyces sp. CB02959]
MLGRAESVGSRIIRTAPQGRADEDVRSISGRERSLSMAWDGLIRLMPSGSGRVRSCRSATGHAGGGCDHRQRIDGIPYRARTGVHWRGHPEGSGPWKTVYVMVAGAAPVPHQGGEREGPQQPDRQHGEGDGRDPQGPVALIGGQLVDQGRQLKTHRRPARPRPCRPNRRARRLLAWAWTSRSTVPPPPAHARVPQVSTVQLRPL